MAARFVVGWDQHVVAVLDAFDLALHDSQLGWIPLIVGGVDGEEPSLDALQLGRWIVVAGSLVLIQQVVSVGRPCLRQTLAQKLIGLLPSWRRLVERPSASIRSNPKVHLGQLYAARLLGVVAAVPLRVIADYVY